MSRGVLAPMKASAEDSPALPANYRVGRQRGRRVRAEAVSITPRSIWPRPWARRRCERNCVRRLGRVDRKIGGLEQVGGFLEWAVRLVAGNPDTGRDGQRDPRARHWPRCDSAANALGDGGSGRAAGCRQDQNHFFAAIAGGKILGPRCSREQFPQCRNTSSPV